MALTDTGIRAKKTKATAFRLADTGGLYLLVSPRAANYGVGITATRGNRKPCHSAAIPMSR